MNVLADVTRPEDEPHAAAQSAADLPWPSEKAGFYALFVVILATFLSFFDMTVFGMLAERIKTSFGLGDAALGFVLGPATILAYVFIGIPLARLVDIFPRKYVLSAGIAIIGAITALGGFAQNVGQFVGTRLFVGAGGAAHGPGSYSILADFFRPKRIPLVFALLQLGFILGLTLGTLGGGQLIALTAHWPQTSQVMGITIFNWQWILMIVGLPGLIVAILFLFVREPPRRTAPDVAPLIPQDASFGRKIVAFTGLDALRAINMRGRAYYPLFAALALAAVESQGINAWRVPFILRTYGWNEAQIGNALAPMLLAGMLIGITLGGAFVTWLGKRYKDANIRAAAILFGCTTIMAIAAPLMPTPELALGCMALGIMFGLAGAVPQNAAIQRIAPNEMRGQVTAVYLFMFTFFGAVGSFVIGFVGQYIVGDPQRIWLALLITALAFLPAATVFMVLGIRPYREEVERLEALGL